MVRRYKILLLLGFVFILLTTAAYIILWAPNTREGQGRAVFIPKGASFHQVLDSLEVTGVINTRWTLDFAGRILGLTKSIKTGKYVFPHSLSNMEILHDLAEGKSRVLVALSVLEGWRMERIALHAAKTLGCDAEKFIALCDKESFRRNLGIDAASMEGYLLPDTYRFLWQTDEEEVITRLVTEFKRFYNDSLRKRQQEVRMSLNEVLTLASIVEGEALLDRERPIIAGVYLNRLKKRMRLEADPTVQYAIPDGPRRLNYSDLRISSPYNTYLRYGLPPGPINSPGRKSILAALYPESHSYLYFVADGTGGHIFSRSYAEHRKAVQSYRRMRREAAKASGL